MRACQPHTHSNGISHSSGKYYLGSRAHLELEFYLEDLQQDGAPKCSRCNKLVTKVGFPNVGERL